MKKVLFVFITLAVLCILYAYVINDGLYVYEKMTLSKLELINEYSSLNFPENTIIDRFSIEDNCSDDFVLGHNEVLRAKLKISVKEIEKIFKDETAEQTYDHVFGFPEESTENISFVIWKPYAVVKWIDKTQRNIYVTVMKPESNYTTVYIYVDYLGWNLFKTK